MHQLMPSTNPFFRIEIQRNYPGHQLPIHSSQKGLRKQNEERGLEGVEAKQ